MRMNEDRLLKVVMLEMGAEFEAESGDVWMGGYLCGRPPRFVNGRGEEGADGCGLEGSKGWMEEGGTEAP